MNSDFPVSGPNPNGKPGMFLGALQSLPPMAEVRLTIDDVQRHLNRSRASVYRYANTDPDLLNPPTTPKSSTPKFAATKTNP